jgi:hypothetical protein
MLRKRKYDIIFIMLSAGVLTVIIKTGNADILEKFSLIFIILAYFIGKGIGAGLKEREWREKTENNEENER